jgi:hypothetical protein
LTSLLARLDEREVGLGKRSRGSTDGLDLKGLAMEARWRLRQSVEPMAYTLGCFMFHDLPY